MTMPQLLSQLRAELEKRGRGSRADLARFAQVKPATVSDWLAEPPRRYPDGERTLAVLEWLALPPMTKSE